MQPIRQIYEQAPEFISVPEELRSRRVEFILWPLDEEQTGKSTQTRPSFHIADVDAIEIPSREDRNARR